MSRSGIFLFCLLITFISSCKQNEQQTWVVPDNPLMTKWADDIDPDEPWPLYPRPIMQRDDWANLNGMWDYSISDQKNRPDKWDGKILVPYPVESALSGVKKRPGENEYIWYKREFKIPSSWKNKRVVLNFEACDWETKVWIDNELAGEHRGGYDPFSFEITKMLNAGKKHEIIIRVWDPTSEGNQPRGKQVSNPHGIWYTPSSGIWQTVWLEPVPESYILSLYTETDIDAGKIVITPDIANLSDGLTARTRILNNGELLAEQESTGDNEIIIAIDNFELWQPGNPVLYDIEIELLKNDRITDKIKSYTGFRKISLGKTEDGFTRMLLNNEFIFQNGPLDQGFWPDGLYTPPTEEAMLYDLEMIRKMGFNMLRKHVKIENRRFYYWCDKMGLLVWQDMPNGDRHIGRDGNDIDRSDESAAQFEFELGRLIRSRYNHPSIIVWVPFNEGWGQYKTEIITDLIKKTDPTRLVNSASGWSDRGTGDILDIHHYPEPRCPEAEEDRAIVLGEFGGLGLPVHGHTWEQKNWAYENMDDSLALLRKYREFYEIVYRMAEEKGLSASVYTQITDVETETNGLLTYDREVDKMGAENLYWINTGKDESK